jgi:hypothetical protein
LKLRSFYPSAGFHRPGPPCPAGMNVLKDTPSVSKTGEADFSREYACDTEEN